MAQPEINQYPAADAASDRAQWGLLSTSQTGRPSDQSAAGLSMLSQDRVLNAITSVALGVAHPASRLATGRAGASVRISAVLESWRATVRELSQLPQSSPDRPRLRALSESLRDTYHRLFAERRDDSSGP